MDELKVRYLKSEKDFVIDYPNKYDAWEMHELMRSDVFKEFKYSLEDRGYDFTTFKMSVKRKFEIIECKECGGSGFSKAGTGYDAVCDQCGGKGLLPVK